VIHGKPPLPILPDITLAQTGSSICSLLLTKTAPEQADE
jgi:hypothetical protein